MAFSPFSEFLFMFSIDLCRIPRSGYLSFGNRKKPQGAKSGEYGSCAMTFVSCLAKNSVTIRLECLLNVLFAKNSGLSVRVAATRFIPKTLNHNVLSRSIRDVESLWYLSNANTTIFEHNFLHFFDVIVNRGGWTTRMRQVFYDLSTRTECFMPLKYLRSR